MAHEHYFKSVNGLQQIDVYRVLERFGVADPAIQHAIKKLLVAGGRGAKDSDKDVQEAIDALTRWQQMKKENEFILPASKPLGQVFQGILDGIRTSELSEEVKKPIGRRIEGKDGSWVLEEDGTLRIGNVVIPPDGGMSMPDVPAEIGNLDTEQRIFTAADFVIKNSGDGPFLAVRETVKPVNTTIPNNGAKCKAGRKYAKKRPSKFEDEVAAPLRKVAPRRKKR